MKNFLAGLIIALFIFLVIASTWGIINILTWLICLCFGWTYTLLIGTGIFLITLLAGLIVKWLKNL